MSARGQTPSQTVGPFFHLRLGGPGQQVLVAPGTPGAIRIEGCVRDGQGAPVDDALIELWQADAEGRYCHPRDRWPPRRGDFTGGMGHSPAAPGGAPSWTGFGRATSGAGGAYSFTTCKPGRVQGAPEAPHVNLVVLARGLLGHLHTRVYFDDEAADNARDPVLARVPPGRRRTLIAARLSPGAEAAGEIPVYRHDLVLQGADETVFFEL